jgi:hypothetical protein
MNHARENRKKCNNQKVKSDVALFFADYLLVFAFFSSRVCVRFSIMWMYEYDKYNSRCWWYSR